MAEGLNKVILLGNLCADPDLRFGQGGADTAVLRLRLATNESYFDKRSNERKERTEYHSVTVFGKRGEALQKILSKGAAICVEGRLSTSSYEKNGEKRYSTAVIASEVILTGSRRDGGGGDASRFPNNPNNPRNAPQGGGDDAPDPGADDDIPF